MAKLLVTGGAGYIGSLLTLKLVEAGHQLVVVDDLSAGIKREMTGAILVVENLANTIVLEKLFRDQAFDAVIHLAASVSAPESMEKPLHYYTNNTSNTIGLLEACRKNGVKTFIYSSTAAVYGLTYGQSPVQETSPLAPISPYGASKMMCERMIEDMARVTGLRYAILRYFNVAGADPKGRVGQWGATATHLVKVACQAALGLRQGMTINGTDYLTADGTCVRDYIHVEDLASAHILALESLLGGGASGIFNCGYGHGHSVREVIAAVQRVSGVDFPVNDGPRRLGDPPMLVASTERIKQALGWRPEYDDLDYIVGTAFDWEKKRLKMNLG